MGKIKLLVSLLLASTISTVPACGSMGGGMRFVDPPIVASEVA